MNKAVWKFSPHREIGEPFVISLPQDSEILCAKLQEDYPRIWALVDPDVTVMADRKFVWVGTGQKFTVREDEYFAHIDTLLMRNGTLVFHLFEILRVVRDPGVIGS